MAERLSFGSESEITLRCNDETDKKTITSFLKKIPLIKRIISHNNDDDNKHKDITTTTNVNDEDITNNKLPTINKKLKYNMQHSKRGLAIMINNVDFEDKALERSAAKEDVTQLKRSFYKLGFDVGIFDNCTSNKMYEIVNVVKEMDHANSDCFVCIIMSHGVNGSIWSVDTNLIELNDLAKPIRECPTLVGKPKVFVINACRGQKHDCGVVADSVNLRDSEPLYYPLEADFLWVFSTPANYTSWSDGSSFIQSLTKAFDKYAYKKNFLHVLHYTNYLMSQDEDEWEKENKNQISNYACTFTKDLYFVPKPV